MTRYKYMLKYIIGLTLILLLTGCFTSKKHGEFTAKTNPNYSDTFVYDTHSPYRKVLKRCISARETLGSCSLSTLPFISQEEVNITKKTIMQRVVVSHAWMAERFSKMLDLLDDDIKQLLGATTAIVIDDDIIPAYYWSLTGAVYLDPRYLWLTPSEAKTITKRSDFRSGNGSRLPYFRVSRFVKDEQYASRYFSLDGNVTRTVEDIKYNFAHLLYHELAHANDFYRPESLKNVDKKKPVYAVLESIRSQRISTQLTRDLPLSSAILKNLGSVLFAGVSPGEMLLTYTANEIGTFFEDDSAVDMYGYSNQYEDLAMLFELVILKYHYDIERDIAFIDKVDDENATYTDYVVGWGVRNRVATEQVRERALFVVKNILPNVTDWDTFFASAIGTTEKLREVNWRDSIHLEANSSTMQQKYKFEDRKINPMDLELPPL